MPFDGCVRDWPEKPDHEPTRRESSGVSYIWMFGQWIWLGITTLVFGGLSVSLFVLDWCAGGSDQPSV